MKPQVIGSFARLNMMRATILPLVAGIACSNPRDPPLPAGAQSFVPPPIYTRWWGMVESCSGVKGTLDKVEWYEVPGVLRDPRSGESVQGYHLGGSNRIVLRRNATLDGSGVRHEMLHALLRVRGHPRAAFLQRCGGVVSCAPQCVRDGGPVTPPDPATPTVAPAALEVTSEVSPEDPSLSNDGGHFTFTITVTNPLPHPVVALLPPGPDGDTAMSFPYDIRDSHGRLSSGDLALDKGIAYFSAGETKRHVIDVAVAEIDFPSTYALPGQGDRPIALPPGTYTFRGGYGDHWAADLTVVLSP
jgi:hypothetical protein